MSSSSAISDTDQANRPNQFADEYDVVIGGFGYAGAMAAITAADQGARVALLEKLPHPGGNSVLSGGSCVFGLDFGQTLDYLRTTCDENTDDDVLVAFAEGMVDIPNILTPLAEAVGLETYREPRGDAAYPFPGAATLRSMRVTRNESYPGLDWVTGAKAGATLFWVLMANVEARQGITVFYESPMTDLIKEGGEVVGCTATIDGVETRLLARRAVILCTGGFEHNRRMIRHYIGSQPAEPAVSPLGNTGDGILMGQKAGAALWHMWHLHGGYGFRIPDIPVAIRHACTGPRANEKPMPWILLNRSGRRFMNEYPPAPQDTPIRELLRYDPDTQTYPNIPAYMILDEEGRKFGPLASPVMNDPSISYEWSNDNQKEIDSGLLQRAETLREAAEIVGVAPEQLERSVEEWNAACKNGEDTEFGRPGWSMNAIAAGPYYVIEVHPIITNTQGGLVHDARQQVLDPFGEPIPRLYKAGEIGSIFGHLYLLGGNNSECMIGGRTAGTNAATEKPHQLDAAIAASRA